MNIVPAGGSKAGGGGLFQKLLGTFASNQQILQDHQLRMARTTHDVNEKVRGQHKMSMNGIEALKTAHDATQEKFTADHPDVVAGKPGANVGEFVRPHLAEDTQLAGLQVDSKGQWQTGPVAGIKRTLKVNERKKTPLKDIDSEDVKEEVAPVGRNANFADTQAAVTAGHITPEQGADLSKGYNTKYESYKSKNPTYKGSSEQHIAKVNNNLDNMETK